jgi:hypothetical protein
MRKRKHPTTEELADPEHSRAEDAAEPKGPPAGEVADPKYLTTEEMAARFRTSPETVRYWRHIGKGPQSFKVGRRVLYAVEDVEAWEQSARNTPAGAA